jgi:hypothetical protein
VDLRRVGRGKLELTAGEGVIPARRRIVDSRAAHLWRNT